MVHSYQHEHDNLFFAILIDALVKDAQYKHFTFTNLCFNTVEDPNKKNIYFTLGHRKKKSIQIDCI